MTSGDLTRRRFIAAASAGSLAAAASGAIPAYGDVAKKATQLAILGGEPVRKNKPWPDWPSCCWDEDLTSTLLKTAKSGIWCRIQSASGTVPTFEKEYAKLMETKFCVSTGAGTQALHTCVEAMGIGPGDEVITSPYTDPGTIQGILSARALPVLADLDIESYQLDPADVERKINENTRAIMPVHMMGQPADMDSIMAIARKHNLKVIEDACQAHLAVHRGRKLGTIGDVGCFSFQSSKTIACGEGGGIIGSDDELMDKCYTVHNHGTSRRGKTELIGPKYRMNEFEAAVLLGQLGGAVERWRRRNENAAYLTARLKDIPGLTPQKLYPGTESGSFYLYTMSYHKDQFDGVSRDVFLKAMNAEGIGLSPYIAQGLHREPWIDHIVSSRSYQKMYSPERLRQFGEQRACPKCDQVCEEMVMLWASGPLLAPKEEVADIADAIEKVWENRAKLRQV